MGAALLRSIIGRVDATNHNRDREQAHTVTELARDSHIDVCLGLDHRGTVLIDGETVTRRLVPELYDTYLRLRDSGRLDHLIDCGLIRTWNTDSEGSTTVSHDHIPFVSYPQEWTVEMLRQATLVILRLAVALADCGLSLQDPHPWNITFYNGRPIYYDFSSIFPGPTLHQRAVGDLFKGCYLPLWLRSRRVFARHASHVARAVLQSEHEWRFWKQPRADWRRVFDRNRAGALCRTFWNIVRRWEDKPKHMLEALYEHVAALRFESQPSKWGEYLDPGGEYDNIGSFSPKASAVASLLKHVPKGRVLDLACNKGWFCGYARQLGHIVFGVDVDENAVDAARPRAVKHGFDTGCMNVLWPTPPQGPLLKYSSATSRFRADTVLMIALQHHLNLCQGVGFEVVVALALQYGARNVIIEWTSAEDVVVQTWLRSGTLSSVPLWYTEDQFVQAWRRFFPTVQVVPSGAGHSGFAGKAQRQMYLFQR